MKKIITIAFLLMLMVNTFAQEWDQAPPTTYLNTNNNQLRSTNNAWNLQFTTNITSQNWANHIYGIETDGSYFYITNWKSNKFYKVTTVGTLVDSFALAGADLFTTTGRSIRDLTYDGQYFYGGTIYNIIYKMDFTSHTLVDSITLPLGFNVRFIAYDPTANSGAGGLWVGPWNTQGPRLYSMNGTFLDSIPAINLGTYSASGAAFDNVSPGGPYLWLYSQASGGNYNDLIQVKISTKMPTGLVHDVSTEIPSVAGTASGGLFIKTNLIGSTTTIGGITQGGTIWGYDIASSYFPQKGMAISSLNTQNYIQVNTTQTLSGSLRNVGLDAITSFNLKYSINGDTAITQNVIGVNISSNSTYNYTHPTQWTPTTDGSFTIKIWAYNINGDSTFKSDTLTKVINTMTVLTMKRIVLEDYVGIHSQYSSDGDRIANDYKALHPNDVFLINIHQGGFAAPNTGEPNYRTSFGDSLAHQAGLTIYPSGTINRHLFESANKTALDRIYWNTDCDEILAMPTYASISLTASAVTTTRILTVNVNANYVNNSPALNLMNVALVQDSVLGPQVYGITYNPTQVMPDGVTYIHMNMLRHLITGQWGDTISTTTSGTNFQKTYTYTLPDNINGVGLDINHLKIVAFITEGKQEIATGEETSVSVIQSIQHLNTNCFKMYPNPSKGIVNITGISGKSQITVTNIFGENIMYVENTKVLDLSKFANGIYFVKINSNNNIVTEKIILNK